MLNMTDLIDKKLLSELYWNCRQTNTQLGKKLHTSKQVIAYRIEQLEKKEILLSYHALIDWRKLGYNSIRVYLKLHNMNPRIEKEIHQRIKEDPLFMWSIKFEGEFDLAFYVWVKSIPEFAKKWGEFLRRYRKYILRQEIYESVNMVNYPLKPFSDRYLAEEKIQGEEGFVEYDKIDYEILKALTEDARISLIDLAERIKMTPKAALYRLKNLEKNGVLLGYNALINTNKLGYYFYKIDFYLKDTSKLSEMNDFAKNHKEIIYRMTTIGGPDFEIEVLVKDVVEMKNIINEVVHKFSESVDFYRFHRFDYTLKQIYLPGENLKN